MCVAWASMCSSVSPRSSCLISMAWVVSSIPPFRPPTHAWFDARMLVSHDPFFDAAFQWLFSLRLCPTENGYLCTCPHVHTGCLEMFSTRMPPLILSAALSWRGVLWKDFWGIHFLIFLLYYLSYSRWLFEQPQFGEMTFVSHVTDEQMASPNEDTTSCTSLTSWNNSNLQNVIEVHAMAIS